MAIPAMVSNKPVPKFLEHIRRTGIPAKVDGKYLKSVGFTGSNDASVINLFKSLGFIDASGVPTEIWRRYKGATESGARVILGNAIKTCYRSLFDLYSDADRKDDEALTNWIRANTDKGDVTISRGLATFKALRNAASFEVSSTPSDIKIPEDEPVTEPVKPAVTVNPPSDSIHSGVRPGITINIELHIAATSDPTVYDNFFAAMKRHLYNGS